MIEVPLGVVKVGALLGPEGMIVPRDGREKIIAMVRKSMGGSLPIRSEIDAVDVPAIEGSPTPVLRLVPIDRGLRVSAFVRPFGEDGPHYLPGHAGKSVLAMIDGQRQRANRDLDRERAAAAAVVAACPTLARFGADGHEWAIEDLESSLELMLELQACSPPVTAEWPEGGKIRVGRAVTPRAVVDQAGPARDWFQIRGEVQADEDLIIDMQDLIERAAPRRVASSSWTTAGSSR